MHARYLPLLAFAWGGSSAAAQAGPAATAPAAQVAATDDSRLHEIVRTVSAARVERDVRALAGFGTRHTLSDTVSGTRGIGAARRWLFSEFQAISQQCGGCLEVQYVGDLLRGDTASRVRADTRVVNVVAVQRGRASTPYYVLITGHYDSRVSDVMDARSDAPGANDDASGTAATLEAARVLSRHRFEGTIVYAALAGEEQGLLGGRILARHARDRGWRIEGVLNNDIIGNSEGITGIVDNAHVRVFAPGIPASATAAELRALLSYGGELDTPSRQLARYVDRVADHYLPNLDAQIIYRLDRFGRGGDHTPFFEAGFPAVRLTETQENYNRQHQNLRTENGIRYGDLPDAVDYPYAARIIALNAATAASLGWAPPAPDSVTIRGGVSPSTVLRWAGPASDNLAGYRIYWRAPTEAQWTRSRFVPGTATEHTLENVVIDNYFFGVAAVGTGGHESRVVFPRPGRR